MYYLLIPLNARAKKLDIYAANASIEGKKEKSEAYKRRALTQYIQSKNSENKDRQ